MHQDSQSISSLRRQRLFDFVDFQFKYKSVLDWKKTGSLYPSISSAGELEAAKISSASIKNAGVNYRAGSRIIKAVNDAGFNKI